MECKVYSVRSVSWQVLQPLRRVQHHSMLLWRLVMWNQAGDTTLSRRIARAEASHVMSVLDFRAHVQWGCQSPPLLPFVAFASCPLAQEWLSPRHSDVVTFLFD